MKWLIDLFRRFRKEASPEEKKRQYSISGWVRGADGDYSSGSESIFRRGGVWCRWNYESGREEEFPTLHAAIKRARPPALLLDGQENL